MPHGAEQARAGHVRVHARARSGNRPRCMARVAAAEHLVDVDEREESAHGVVLVVATLIALGMASRSSAGTMDRTTEIVGSDVADHNTCFLGSNLLRRAVVGQLSQPEKEHERPALSFRMPQHVAVTV
jgi:hypothetical protein